ncbi:unnamed protein product [Phytomonas sp. EM1]|nr:unnamed protein product [Phytomonas sp. EM1]|eukprot:CCW59698.1 unnamed protein product [Phytomonas sp. isolate EM1]
MPPVQQQESESSTVLDDEADEKALFQLSWVDVLSRLFSNVQPVQEPEVSPYPVVNIKYSSAFDLTMGYYRALRHTMTSLHAPKALSMDVTTSLSAIGGRAACAKWMLLLSFALRHCIAHYTIWKDRRDFILCPAIFQWATQEQIPSIDFNQSPTFLGSQTSLEGPAKLSESERQAMQQKYQDLVRQWLPRREDLAAPKHRESKIVDHWFSLWQAVRWELQTIDCFSRLYHKNFQVWHHRRELLSYVLKTMETDDGKFSSVMATTADFEDYLLEEHGMTFAEIDERVVCEAVLCHKDAKNYHIWLHRSWFISAFSFLLQLPEDWDKWRTFLSMFPEIHCHDVIINANAEDFAVDPIWREINCRRLPLPSCPLADEVTFTSHMIQEDHLNNSAWCHRLLIIKKHLIETLLQQHHAQLRCDQRRQVDAAKLRDVISAVCRLEVDFGLQWAVVEPTNECAFVYARSVVELHQAVMLRLLLLDRALQDSSDSPACVDFLLLSDLLPPLASVCTQHCLSEDLSCMGNTQRSHLRAYEETNHNSSRTSRPFRYSINDLVYRIRKLSWSEYLGTFALLIFQKEILCTHVAPRVQELRQAFEQASLEHVAPPPSQDSAVDDKEVGPVRAAMYANTSQFMIDNLWQVVAAQYHSAFHFLEQTWLLYGDSSFRASVAQMRQPEVYVAHGVTSDMRTPSSAKAKDIAAAKAAADALSLTNDNISSKDTNLTAAVDFFTTVEAEALYLAKRLLIEDSIRSKYWKHEAWTVLYRQY